MAYNNNEEYDRTSKSQFSNERISGYGRVFQDPIRISAGDKALKVIVKVFAQSAAYNKELGTNLKHSDARELNLWNGDAQWALDNVHKGDYVTYFGDLSYSEYTNDNGVTYSSAQVTNTVIGLMPSPFYGRDNSGYQRNYQQRGDQGGNQDGEQQGPRRGGYNTDQRGTVNRRQSNQSEQRSNFAFDDDEFGDLSA